MELKIPKSWKDHAAKYQPPPPPVVEEEEVEVLDPKVYLVAGQMIVFYSAVFVMGRSTALDDILFDFNRTLTTTGMNDPTTSAKGSGIGFTKLIKEGMGVEVDVFYELETKRFYYVDDSVPPESNW